MSRRGGARSSSSECASPVAPGVELEVVRPQRLPLGDRGDELLLAPAAQGVVRPALLAERRAGLAGELLAARRPGAVGGEHPRRVRAAAAACRAASGTGGGPARRPTARVAGREQVGPADVADEQRVAGEHAVRDLVVGMLVDDDADRLGRVARRRQDLERHLAERQPLPVAQRLDRELDVGRLPVRDRGAGLRGQLQVTAEEVGVHVGLDDPLDRQPVGGRLLEVDARRRGEGRRRRRARSTRRRRGTRPGTGRRGSAG